MASIVPPHPRVIELRVMRRRKMRRVLQTSIAAAALALIARLILPPSHALLLVLVGVSFVGVASAVVLRFVEQPGEIVVRRRRHRRESPLVH